MYKVTIKQWSATIYAWVINNVSVSRIDDCTYWFENHNDYLAMCHEFPDDIVTEEKQCLSSK